MNFKKAVLKGAAFFVAEFLLKMDKECFIPSFSSIHTQQKFIVVFGIAHSVLEKFHCFDGIHICHKFAHDDYVVD